MKKLFLITNIISFLIFNTLYPALGENKEIQEALPSLKEQNLRRLIKAIKANELEDISQFEPQYFSMPAHEIHENVLHIAARSSSVTCNTLRYLIHARDCDVNTQNRCGNTPLHVLSQCASGNLFQWASDNLYEKVTVLMEAGAKIDQHNKYGVTPLECATFHNLEDLAKILVFKYQATISPSAIERAASRSSDELAIQLAQRAAA